MRTTIVLAVAGLGFLLMLPLDDGAAQLTGAAVGLRVGHRLEPVLYDKDIAPILVNKCLVCHSGTVKESNLDLSSYATLLKGGKRGQPLVPGQSAESLLVRLVSRAEKPIMPPKDEEPLTGQELALLKRWIDAGAQAPAGARQRLPVHVKVPAARVHPVRAVDIPPDQKTVAAGRGNQIHVFDIASGNHLRTLLDPDLKTPDRKPVQAAHLSIVEALAYSPDGRTIASGSFQEVVLWDAATGQLKQKLTGFADRVVALDFSADGKYLATGGGVPAQDGELKVFEAASGKLVVDINKGGHSDTVYGVCFSPDTTKLASCGADKFVKVFELPSGKFLKAFEGHTHYVLAVGWKADGKLLASGGADKAVKVWDYATGEQARTIHSHDKEVTRIRFVGQTAQLVTCSGDQTVRCFNADTGGTVRYFAGNSDFLYAVAVSKDGRVVVAGGEEGLVRLYNGADGQLVKTLAPPGVRLAPPR